MNIAQLKEMPIDSKTGGFDLSIKTCKKIWQVEDEWFQKVTLMDKTGDILADVNITADGIPSDGKKFGYKVANYNPINNRMVLHITVCEIQESEDALHLKAGKCGKKLLVHEHTTPDALSWTNETDQELQQWHKDREEEIRSKIRCWLESAAIQKEGLTNLTDAHKKAISDRVDFVITGE